MKYNFTGIKVICLISFISIFSLSNLYSQDRVNLHKQIDKIILYDTEINFTKTPGLIIGVKVQDSIFYFGYGSTSKDSSISPSENTLFEIGGLTKAFTGSLVSLLVKEGQINYDSSFNSYIPKRYVNSTTNNITIEELLTHTSGMPRMPMEFGIKEFEDNNPYAHYSKKDLMEFYKEYFPIPDRKSKKKKPVRKKTRNIKSEKYTYAHLNYALLEVAIENQTQKHFETLLSEKVLKPIGLTNTCFHLSDEQKNKLTSGYSVSGKAMHPWTFSSFQASEGLKSTAKDLITFAEVHMGKHHSELAKAFESTHPALYKSGLNKTVFATRGWHVIKNKKYYDVIAHTGTTSGHRAFLGFVKETETAVVVLANSEHDLEGLGYRILQMINNYWQKW